METFVWGTIFGIIGMGFLSYGKKQAAIVPIICGILLMIFPYFISNVILLVSIGILLSLLPFVIKR